MEAIDRDATEYVYWHGTVPPWWNCDPDGLQRQHSRRRQYTFVMEDYPRQSPVQSAEQRSK
ncbi:MAG TPA: hypothetical protein VF906_04170 [Candidatus Bathyarchaeia archaeon]